MIDMNFEDTLKNVDEIIKKLSDGNTGLEEGIELYKDGMTRIGGLMKELEQAKNTVLSVKIDGEQA